MSVKATLEAVGRESASSNGVWRLTLGLLGFLAVALTSVITWEATQAIQTLKEHSAALGNMERSQAVVKSQLADQNKRVDTAIAQTGAIEARTRTLEDNFSKIDGKLDVILSVIKSK